MDNIIPPHQQTGYYGKGTGLYRHIRGRRRKARRHHPGKRGAERHHPCKPGLSPIPEIPAGQTTHPCRLTSTTTNHQRKTEQRRAPAASLTVPPIPRENVKPLNKCKAHSSTVIPCTAACADNRENSSSVKPQHTSCFSRSARAAASFSISKEISFSCARGTSAPGTFSHL